MTKKQEIWQGGVCEGLVVDSEETTKRLREIYGENDIETDSKTMAEINEDELDFFDWLMLG